MNSDLSDEPESTVEVPHGLRKSPIEGDPYEGPWGYSWHAPVWVVLSKKMAIVCKTKDEAMAQKICNLRAMELGIETD